MSVDNDSLIQLPAEVYVQIFSYLESVDLKSCSQVSILWNRSANDKNSWKDAFDFSVKQAHDAYLLDEDKEPLMKEWKKLLYKKYRRDGLNVMMELFGGRENFEKLPLLVIAGEANDYLNVIVPEVIGHSIMRGRDVNGHSFFCIKAKKTIGDNEILFCQIFFQRYVNDACWSFNESPEKEIILTKGNIINRFGKINYCNNDSYNKLKTLISTRTITVPSVLNLNRDYYKIDLI